MEILCRKGCIIYSAEKLQKSVSGACAKAVENSLTPDMGQSLAFAVISSAAQNLEGLCFKYCDNECIAKTAGSANVAGYIGGILSVDYHIPEEE